MSAEDSSIGSLSLGSPNNSNGEQDRDQSTIEEEGQFWQEEPWQDNLDPNFGNPRGAAGRPPAREAPPPYPGEGQANPQGNNLLQMIQGLFQAQQQSYNTQVEANQRFQEAQNALGNDIRTMVHAQNALGNDLRNLAMIVDQNRLWVGLRGL